MAEVIGLAASLLTLIKACQLVSEGTFRLYGKIHGAPRELARVRSQLFLLKSGLELLQLMHTDQWVADNILNSGALEKLKQGLREAGDTITLIHDTCQQHSGKQGKRLHWALLGSDITKKHLKDLQATESTLNTVLQLLHFRQSCSLSSLMSSLSASQTAMKQEITDVKILIRGLGHEYFQVSESHSSETGLVARTRLLHARPKTAATKVLPEFWLLRFLGLSGRISTTWNDKESVYSVSIRSVLPFSGILGRHALLIDFALRQLSLDRLNLSLLPGGGLAIKNIVPDNSPIMCACYQGDVDRVRDLLARKLAFLSDVTESNSTLLRYAIEGGSMRMVEFLLQNGANVNWSFGRYQTSALGWAIDLKQIDIARLLLSYGAQLNHTSANGWSPMVYIWGDNEVVPEGAADWLAILTAEWHYHAIELDSADSHGWALLHRVASFGSAADVAAIIKLGASTRSHIPPLRWTAIHQAVFYGRLDTFLELLPHYDHLDIDNPDTRGWTLLHIAASAGHGNIIRHLLRLGADPFRQSWPAYTHIPEVLYGKRCTPAEVALAQSLERYQKYIDIMHELELLDDAPDDQSEVFFDAETHLVLSES